ncbi:MAG: amidophosphoribosyltransferase [bacterium]|nr:amidophosphoribosyltransferase [bacterium]
MCGIVGVHSIVDAPKAILEALLMLQHRGQEASGIALADGKEFMEPAPHRVLGTVSEFERDWPGFVPKKALLGIGHVRYGTSGEHSSLANAQPLVLSSSLGPFSIAHNGDTPGFEEMQEKLQSRGVKFLSTADTEVIGQEIVARAETVETMQEAMLEALAGIKGAFALVMATPSALVGCRDPLGYRPLSLGRLDDGWVLASESCAFDALRAEYIRDIEPGELVWIDENGPQSFRFGEPKPNRQQCVFELIYFSRPDSYVFGRYVDGMRKALGEKLAEEVGIPKHEDMVFIGVPDSAMFAAEGYEKATGIRLRSSVLIRNHYTGRTFIEEGTEKRENGVRLKFNPLHREIEGKWVVLIDDSLVRGTTMRRLVRMMRENGAVGVTLLIASPPILHPCYYGIDMKTYEQLRAAVEKGDIDKICTFVEADELHYLSLEGFRQVVGQDGSETKDFCLACFDGKHAL